MADYCVYSPDSAIALISPTESNVNDAEKDQEE